MFYHFETHEMDISEMAILILDDITALFCLERAMFDY
jgi:hypothetical protein